MISVAFALNLAFLVVIVGMSLVALNQMTMATTHQLRLCYVLIAAGAFAMLAGDSDSGGLMLHAGIALGLVSRYRERKSSQPVQPVKQP